MFKPHEDFKQIDDAALLWRYQDLPRYLDLLLKQQLFFSRADRFEDPFEGQYTQEAKEELVKEQVEKMGNDKADETVVQNAKQQVERLTEEHIARRTFVTINSWHWNDVENYAMWKIYAKGTYGLAIQTTYERLKQCFRKAKQPVFIGKVDYDDNCEAFLLNGSLKPFLHKRKMYAYENEVRCCYVIPEDKSFNWQAQDTNDGVFIDVDLDTLIERIYISPYSPKWIYDIVTGINKKFNIQKEIVHSTVFDTAEY
ncbi:MAG: hypothetical protein ACJ8MO_07085 [Bacillus sp. (in: firmicutes)]